ncbi:hypothetical protein ABT341_00330 [Pseudonocardia alni]|uniref:hypothetical protein n=1 Tax=Pseudonocardia alni TaxID=33907 RepID=UPI00332F36DA
MTPAVPDLAPRDVPPLHFACTVCDEIHPVRTRPLPGVRRMPIYSHGPRGNRCPGGGLPGKTWIQTRRLPQWQDMTDLDRGAVLMFLWKVHWERSFAYARENYPCTYRDAPALVALTKRDACSHAAQVVKELTGEPGDRAIARYLGEAEYKRLYDLALHTEWTERRCG